MGMLSFTFLVNLKKRSGLETRSLFYTTQVLQVV